jgi:polyphosphate kinase
MKNEDKYINREFSWLQFNKKVLDEANDEKNLPLDRLFFLTITASNLDEFMMVRVGGLQLVATQKIHQPLDIVNMTPRQQLSMISKECKQIAKQQAKSLSAIEKELEKDNIQHLQSNDITDENLKWLENYFINEVMPIITPMQINGKDQQTPILENMSLYQLFAIKGDNPKEPYIYATVPLQRNIKRIIEMPGQTGFNYIFIEELIELFADKIFPNREIVSTFPYRLTRNGDIAVEEEFSDNLANAMKSVLNGRLTSHCVRLEIPENAPKEHIEMLQSLFTIEKAFTIKTANTIDLTAFRQICFSGDFPTLIEKPWLPQPSADIDMTKPLFKQIKSKNILLFHPYESFDPVVKLIHEAADDPDVLAIKQVLYRTSSDSPIIKALIKAANNGKYVTAVIEIKARFDEANNIGWAQKLEEAGIQVIYGVKGLKTHAKICLIVRNEAEGIIRYVHYGTGNYNNKTAKIYSDVGYLTADKEFGMDAASFFNAVAGLSDPIPYEKIYQSPFSIKEKLLEMIESETERANRNQKGLIMAKFNSLVDKDIIDSLYQASQAGVKIEFNIRGICCLRPGVPNLSENIKVVSVIDRFLEHARIIYFHQGGDPNVFISSADWMTRNLEKRIELLIPVESAKEKKMLISILKTSLNDTVKGRTILADGTYSKPSPKSKDNSRSQAIFYKEAEQKAKRKASNKRTRFEPHKNK